MDNIGKIIGGNIKPNKMRDQNVTLPRCNELHPKVRQEVIDGIIWIEQNKFPNGRVAIRVVQGFRSIEYQNDLYAQGRTKPGPIVTKARGGKSYHNYRLAIDFALLYDLDGNGTFEKLSWDTLKDYDIDGEKDWMEVVNYFKSKGWRWGGDFKSIRDEPHLEKTFDYSVSKLLEMYNQGNFIPGTKYLNL